MLREAGSVLCAALLCAACDSRLTSVGSWTDSGHYLEAESGALSGGFEIGADSAASDGHYLSPPFGLTSDKDAGTARAVYDFEVRTPGTYRIWGRIRSPTAENNRFWVKVDDIDFFPWRISVGDIWYWDAIHINTNYGVPVNFELAAGPHRLTIANAVDGVDLDRLYYTPDPKDVPPGNDTPCNPPHSIEIAGVCQPSCGSQGGNQCGAKCAGYNPFVAYDCPACCIAP